MSEQAVARLLEGLRRERALAATERTSEASDPSLDGTIERTERVLALLADGRHAPARDLMEESAYLVVDGWSWRSGLGVELLAVSQAMQRAARR